MTTRLLLALLAFGSAALAAEFKFGEQTFTVPEGYTLERAAGPPLVNRPITMAFDETGALYVADSSGSNAKPAEQNKNPTHRILRLVDRDGDGVFETSTVFADKVSFPEGTMWLDGSLYVAAPPQIWKLTDTDGDGVADQRVVWFDGQTLTGCANDLHGPYAGPDGFIYWCKGAFAEQHHVLADGRTFVTRASHVFRMRPDGTGLDVVMTGGMDNPVDLVFNPRGEMFVSGTFFVNPGNGQRDGILHAVPGGVWGKEHGVLEGHPRTGALMPIMTHLGPAAAAGLELPASDALGLRGDLLCCEFNLHKVSRHVLSPDGATYRTADSDLLATSHADFHPTDVVEDADGSLLIADTGGWYRLCCPTSSLAKPDVLGAIYRLRKAGAPRVDDPRGLRLAWDRPAELPARLDDPRPAVAARAVQALGRQDVAAITGAPQRTLRGKLNALWTLARIPGEAARAANRAALNSANPDLFCLAARHVALWRDQPAVEALLAHFSHADPQVRRAAIAAAGHLGDARALPPLLAAAEREVDRFEQHAIVYALYELYEQLPTRRPSEKVGGSRANQLLQVVETMLATKTKALAPLPVRNVAMPPLSPEQQAAQARRIDELLAAVKSGGDPKRGIKVFENQKSLCLYCHSTHGAGGSLGPDLTKVGAIRTERDLLEAIVFPSATFVRSYEPMVVKTRDAEHFGIITSETSTELILATAEKAQLHLPRGSVLEVQPAPVSLMPPVFDGLLSPAELADLVAYLRTLK